MSAYDFDYATDDILLEDDPEEGSDNEEDEDDESIRPEIDIEDEIPDWDEEV